MMQEENQEKNILERPLALGLFVLILVLLFGFLYMWSKPRTLNEQTLATDSSNQENVHSFSFEAKVTQVLGNTLFVDAFQVVRGQDGNEVVLKQKIVWVNEQVVFFEKDKVTGAVTLSKSGLSEIAINSNLIIYTTQNPFLDNPVTFGNLQSRIVAKKIEIIK